jgi:hypothetical protein
LRAASCLAAWLSTLRTCEGFAGAASMLQTCSPLLYTLPPTAVTGLTCVLQLGPLHLCTSGLCPQATWTLGALAEATGSPVESVRKRMVYWVGCGVCSHAAAPAGAGVSETTYSIIEKAESSAAHKACFAMEEVRVWGLGFVVERGPGCCGVPGLVLGSTHGGGDGPLARRIAM